MNHIISEMCFFSVDRQILWYDLIKFHAFWANICFFTGEYILSSGSQNGSGSSIVEEDNPLLNEASLALDHHPLADLTDDSLGLNDTLGLEHDFTSELLGSSLLESAGVEGLLSNDTLGLPDVFNLEEALQLVGLDEAQPEVCGISLYLLESNTIWRFVKNRQYVSSVFQYRVSRLRNRWCSLLVAWLTRWRGNLDNGTVIYLVLPMIHAGVNVLSRFSYI